MNLNGLRTLNIFSLLLAGLAHAAPDATPTPAPTPAVSVSPGPCSQINDAINSLPATGGIVKLMAGEFVCDSPVIIERDNVSVIGAGSKQTFIRAADGKAMPVVIIGSVINSEIINNIPYPSHVTHYVNLSGVSINGNFRKHPNPGGVECWDPKTNQSLTCGTDVGYFIRNNGLTIRRGEHIRVTDIETKQAFSGGIVVEKLNKDIIMDGFTTTDNFFDGFAGYETSASLFKNFSANKNIYSGISVDCDFAGNVFDHGSASENGDNGVFSADVGHNIFRNMKVLGNKNLGFYIDGWRTPDNKPIPHTCDGNEIIDTVISGPKFGVQINFACEATSIIRTKIKQDKLSCLSINPDAKVAISDSFCTDGRRKVSIDNGRR